MIGPLLTLPKIRKVSRTGRRSPEAILGALPLEPPLPVGAEEVPGGRGQGSPPGAGADRVVDEADAAIRHANHDAAAVRRVVQVPVGAVRRPGAVSADVRP